MPRKRIKAKLLWKIAGTLTFRTKQNRQNQEQSCDIVLDTCSWNKEELSIYLGDTTHMRSVCEELKRLLHVRNWLCHQEVNAGTEPFSSVL